VTIDINELTQILAQGLDLTVGTESLFSSEDGEIKDRTVISLWFHSAHLADVVLP
jgi:hypothetical protein